MSEQEASENSPTVPTTSLVRSPFVDEHGQPRSSAMKAALTEFWTGVKRLPAYIKLAASLARDERIPKKSKAMLLAGGAYAVSPIDLVPGIIPVAGQLDDLYVLLTAIQQAIRFSPAEVADEHLVKYDITRDDVDHDLASVRNLIKEAAIVTAKFGLKTVKDTGNRIRRFAGQYTQRGGSKHDDKPL